MQEASKENRVYFDNLDIFRFIAAMMVVFSHTYEGWHDWSGYPGFMSNNNYKELSFIGNYIDRFILNLSFGVDVFFLISGFLITYLLLKEKEVYGKVNIKKFYIRRILRIWPLYYFAIALTPFLIQWLAPIFKQPDYISNLLYFNNFHAIKTEIWEYPFAHFWSLCVEEHFYVIWPLIIAFIPVKKLPTVFIMIIFISILYRATSYYFNPIAYNLDIYLNTLSRIDTLVLGSLFAYLHFTKPFKLEFHWVVRFIVYFLLISTLFIDRIYSSETMFLALFKKYIYLLAVSFWMGNYMFNPNAFFVFRRKNVIHYFGKISYGIYVYHNMIIPVIFMKIMFNNKIYNMYFYIFVMIGLTLTIAWLSYELYEKWFLKLKDKFSVIRTR
jgi:peptidoglycan/LPS O-acetylase OafA/YrhL